MPRGQRKAKRFVVCVRNTGYVAALELRKIYQAVPDAEAEKHDLLRVIDESGEDYLYPAKFFVALDLPQPVASAVRRATG
jgi:Ca2+-binding EF-hand superfamily protein